MLPYCAENGTTQNGKNELDDYCSESQISSDAASQKDLEQSGRRAIFVLGQPENSRNKSVELRLPTAADLFPELVDPRLDREDTLPSCSALESLEWQEPFVNQTLAYQALSMLARLFRYATSAITAVL